MSALLELRPYQDRTITKFNDAVHGRGLRRFAAVLPTGAGKTVIFSHITNEWIRRGEGGRVMILVHRDELANQAYEKLAAVAPSLKIGIVKAERNEHMGCDVIIASVQTVTKIWRLDDIISSGRIGLVIVDECHHAAAESYISVLTALGCFNESSDCVAFGVTATLSRGDTKSLGDVWQDVIDRVDILDLIPEYLCDVRGKLITVDGLSLAQVAMSGGDYQVGSLSAALMSADAPTFAANAWAEHTPGLPGICFTPSVETAQAFAAEFNDRGMPSAAVWGNMPKDDRRNVLRSAHSGDLQVLVNCMVLTEGFDWPRAQVCMIGRPTTNASLYVQMVGRVLRLFPGKDLAWVLDLVGASEQHRLATLADLSSRRIEIVMEGESLTTAAIREREAASPFLRDYAVNHEDVDLFRRSRATWLQTYKGVWFVSTREELFFIWPGSGPGLYHVGRRPIAFRGGEFTHRDVDLETAMAWGSQEAISADSMVANRSASWRRSGRASDAQLRIANRMKLSVPDGIRKGDLSDMIDIHVASRALDKNLKTEKAYA
jgi:superfamily II DNA or RNA helicase